METFSFDVPLLDPAGDFSGPRAPSSFLTVEDVWITNYRLLSQTSHISLLNGLNDRGTPAGREPDIENIQHTKHQAKRLPKKTQRERRQCNQSTSGTPSI